ncbi:F-box protein SKP2 [Cyberlindnera fabianii]|nr:F-box protein SKP2 [Cyberlindnera fabianii]
MLQLYVQSIDFIKPEKDLSHESTSIVGFNFKPNAPSDNYITLLLEVVSLLPNLSEISLRQISPGFQFPEWTSTLKTYALEHNYYPTLRRLRMSSEFGWSIPLRPNLLWPFGLIDELILYDMVIDSHSLTKPALLTLSNENGPLVSKDAAILESNNRWSPIQSLTLSSCSIASSGSRLLAGYFREVRSLRLVSLKSHYDLLLAHCFPHLETLYIDLNSKCFSLYNSSEALVINTQNNNSNYAYFNSKFVPKFYLNYGHFVEVMEKLPRVNKVSFVNCSFTNITPVDPEDLENPECNLVNTNGFKFFAMLQNFDRVEFIMLKNYKLHQRRTRDEWTKLLQPCFTSTNSVRILDKDGSVLFTRNERP